MINNLKMNKYAHPMANSPTILNSLLEFFKTVTGQKRESKVVNVPNVRLLRFFDEDAKTIH